MAGSDSRELAQNTVHDVASVLDRFRTDSSSTLPAPLQQAVYLARVLRDRAAELQSTEERRAQADLDRLAKHPADLATLVMLTDQAFRAQTPGRAADQLVHVLRERGIPEFFRTLDRAALWGFETLGRWLPKMSVPFVKRAMQQKTAEVILPAEQEPLRNHLRHRWQEGLRMNVNHLGEALLGEREAERRLKGYLKLLSQPDVEVISVKVSTIYSQLNPLARQHTLDELCVRLERLFQAAQSSMFERPDGSVVSKMVYLDMEEYRDKALTVDAFVQTLSRPGLENARAGLALQAYVPDSFESLRRVTEWARGRVAAGGAPVTVRLVKGANMEMERVEASLHGWPLATFRSKLDTDANYYRMLQYGLRPENLAAVRLGVASHNPFTYGYSLCLVHEASAWQQVQFEMIEGMANHQRRALHELVHNVLLYAPACYERDFTHAIGYLVRRLSENTSPDNYLRHSFAARVDEDAWNKIEAQFIESFSRIESLPAAPRRTQDRRQPAEPRGYENRPWQAFQNEPDTDWSLPHNADWAAGICSAWAGRYGDAAANVPLSIAGQEIHEGRDRQESRDPSTGRVVATYPQADEEDIPRAVSCARADTAGWRTMPAAERGETLHRVADELCLRRGELMGAMLAEGGKLFTESDPEISEAIDFCRFYAQAARYFSELLGLSAQGCGVVVVVSPWNFPLAIPCGGVAAALAAGNTVILKPASDTVLIAHQLCQCFWNAGVPREALQFAPCRGSTVGQQLVSHDGVDAVVLTGGTATARQMLAAKPALNLLAETGGKNATIVTALYDRDLAIKHVLHSAFSHGGQKCSATSLLILHEDVYRDRGFRDAFCDAVESLAVGSAWELHTRVGPLIRPPSGELEQALTELLPGEEWAVEPRLAVDGNPNLVRPGVKWGVQPGSVTHCTEFFGPLLGVMPAQDLDEAIRLVNATGYGLTSGLESLDEREHEVWQRSIRAGNLYINRPTTGAIVLRQPFGGMGKSAVGPGIKAGGPNYVVPLMRFATDDDSLQSAGAQPAQTAAPPARVGFLLDSLQQILKEGEDSPPGTSQLEQIDGAAGSYAHWYRTELAPQHDHFRLVGEDNFRRYLTLRKVCVRVHADDTFLEILYRAAAALTVGAPTTISMPHDLVGPVADALVRLRVAMQGESTGAGPSSKPAPPPPHRTALTIVEETDASLAGSIRGGRAGRVRYADPARVPEEIRIAAADALDYVADAPPSPHGRIELLWYLREQSLSQVYHRYGNLGARAGEERAEVL